jgi:hypothetical protein
MKHNIYKERLETLSKLIKLHESNNRRRSNDLTRDREQRKVDEAITTSYAYVVFLLNDYELLDKMKRMVDDPNFIETFKRI